MSGGNPYADGAGEESAENIVDIDDYSVEIDGVAWDGNGVIKEEQVENIWQ